MSAPIFHDQPPDVPVAEIARFERLNDARERALVVSAMGLPHWLVRSGRGYVLLVEEKDREPVSDAVAEFEREEISRAAPRQLEPLRIPKLAVAMTLLAMLVLYRAQMKLPANVETAGIADDLAVRAGQWWRTLTALTLHGGSEHLVSNMSLGIFVFAFVFWRFGTGLGLLGIVLGGALGNALNTLSHFADPHRSLGSSTALFAGLGLLAGAELCARLRHAATTGWQLFVPIGAGFAFFALYGVGGVKADGTPDPASTSIDVRAHLFGLLAGIFLGLVMFRIGMKNGAHRGWQAIGGIAALALLTTAWLLAIPPR